MLTFAEFEAMVTVGGKDLEDRLHRYISARADWDVASDTLWPFVHRALTLHWPWEGASS